MYESPIKIFYGEVSTHIEDGVIRAIQNVGINVDKEELLKTLAYDRGQYEHGYIDGIRSARRRGQWLRTGDDTLKFECSECGWQYNVDTVLGVPAWEYCPHCGSRMDSDEE